MDGEAPTAIWECAGNDVFIPSCLETLQQSGLDEMIDVAINDRGGIEAWSSFSACVRMICVVTSAVIGELLPLVRQDQKREKESAIRQMGVSGEWRGGEVGITLNQAERNRLPGRT